MVETAINLIGTAEDPRGTNRGALVDQWNTAVKAPLGSPWCASFASHCWSQTDVPFASAACEEWHQWALTRGHWTTDTPTPGDLVLFAFDPANPTHADHCGVVVRLYHGAVHSVQGNTDDDGSREGYIVLYKDVPRRVLGYVTLP